MKKLTAMLLSLMMCFSLLAIPAQAAFVPAPDGPGIVIGREPVDLGDGDEDPDEPGISVQVSVKLPEPEQNPPAD